MGHRTGIRRSLRSAALVAILVAATAATSGAQAAPRVSARAAVVMDAADGELLWASNPDLMLPPASTTKILTTLLALESGRLDDSFSVSEYAREQAPTKIDLRPGQRVRLRDLTYALMLKSANDAAVVVAEGLAGSVESFAVRMNIRARQAGATHSQFHNPNGLPDEAHLTTARDLGLILRAALATPGFREVAGTRRIEIPVVSTTANGGTASHWVVLQTHNRLLTGYPVQVLGKTGYTRAAGRCFVGAAELDGREVIVAVLGSSNVWGDTRRLLEYGLGTVAPDAARVQFASLRSAPAASSGASRVASRGRRSAIHASAHGSGKKAHATARRGAAPAESTVGEGDSSAAKPRTKPAAKHASGHKSSCSSCSKKSAQSGSGRSSGGATSGSARSKTQSQTQEARR